MCMAYKVLYRKYRPNKFGNIVGQETIVENLKNSVKENSFSHAYIFTGPRGTGKTSTAKVLAKALVCSNAQNGEPCEKCENCENFTTLPDIIEIDAASNNGVNEIRELRNNVSLAPTSAKYKIYIIDEVHMLTDGAFNALLKTLEEPPSHTIFILATTEIYKVPITILSRCQRYDFKKIDKHKMIEHLNLICQEENISYEDGVLEEIYELSDGCLRDALSILDQSSKIEKKITLIGLLKNYNMISSNSVKELLGYVVDGDVEQIISKIESFEDSGINAQKMIKRMINYLEKIAIDIKVGKSSDFDYTAIITLIEGLNKCYIDARINENVFTIIKLCFLEIIDSSGSSNRSTTSQPVEKEKRNEQETKKTTDKKTEPDEKVVQKDTLTFSDIRINNCFVEVSKTELASLTKIWKELDTNKLKCIKVGNYKPLAASSSYAIFSSEEDSLVDLFNIKHEEIEKTLKKENKPVKVIAITTTQWQIEKDKYKNSVVHNKKYEYIDEPKLDDDNVAVKKEAEDLFAESIVEIS